MAEAFPPAPAGTMTKAMAQRDAMVASGIQTHVANASHTWRPYGSGPLIFNDAKCTTVNGLGLGEASGRVNQIAFDPVARRIFAATGTGGVWMSTNNGDSWASITTTMPTQTAGSVAWLPTDGIMSFKAEADPSNANVVYLATSKGLYRSADAGRSFSDVRLPVSADCTSKYDSFCAFASFVTDVVVQVPGGVPSVAGGRVLAVVGFRTGNEDLYPDGKARSPGNGLYRSDTGAPNTFTALPATTYCNGATAIGFAPRNRVGRTSFRVARGTRQNHNFVYALVQDAVTLRGGSQVDIFPGNLASPRRASATHFNGLYVSADFGTTWTRMADDLKSPPITPPPSRPSARP